MSTRWGPATAGNGRLVLPAPNLPGSIVSMPTLQVTFAEPVRRVGFVITDFWSTTTLSVLGEGFADPGGLASLRAVTRRSAGYPPQFVGFASETPMRARPDIQSAGRHVLPQHRRFPVRGRHERAGSANALADCPRRGRRRTLSVAGTSITTRTAPSAAVARSQAPALGVLSSALRGSAHAWIQIASVWLAATVVFAAALPNGWLGDDQVLLEERLAGLAWASLPGLIGETYWGPLHPDNGLYRPTALLLLGPQRLLFEWTSRGTES